MRDPLNWDWSSLAGSLDEAGFAVQAEVLTPGECEALSTLYDDDRHFRSTVVMARHGFGEGAYKYFDDPLPKLVAVLREKVYARLVPIANGWTEKLGQDHRYPPTLAAFRKMCHAAGQTKPTPLLLRYGPGGYNRLHRDLYSDLAFPIQMAVLLSDPRAFEGGEFMLVENRPRMQARGEVVCLSQGDAVLFAVDQRPVQGARGYYRASMRHGVSRLRAGRRHTLGVIFHDAK